MPLRLYSEALSNENQGNYEQAIESYEIALQEVKKIKFQKHLEDRIIEKLKVLHNVMENKKTSYPEQRLSNKY